MELRLSCLTHFHKTSKGLIEMQETYQTILPMLPLYIKGFQTTIEVSIEAVFLALAAGVLLSFFRLLEIAWLTKLVDFYISFVRGTPVLIQIFIIYYALPAMGIDVAAYWSGVIALGLNSAAYVAEIIRGGLYAIPVGQIESARALGMGKIRTLVRIVLPQVFQVIIPQLTNEFINIVKMSPLLSVITVVELTRVGQQIVGRTYQPVSVYLFIASLYLLLNLSLSLVTSYLESRIALKR